MNDWPQGCRHPNSCSRHRACMYTNCKHGDEAPAALADRMRVATAEIDAQRATQPDIQHDDG